MSTITTSDGTEIYYKDWGDGPAVTLSHGWPLSADMWDGQMLFLAQHGFRCIAHDRRGHGRSSQPSSGNDMDTYADDLATLIEALDLRDITTVGHSTGGGEVARYIGRHGTARVTKIVLISAAPPHLAPTERDPEGLPPEAVNGLLGGMFADRSEFYRNLASQFYGANREGANVSQGVLDQFWSWSMQSGLKSSYECVQSLADSDFTDDLEKFDVPTLLLHGEDDQVVPVGNSMKSARIIKNAKDIYYPGAPHGITATHQDEINAELHAFLQNSRRRHSKEVRDEDRRHRRDRAHRFQARRHVPRARSRSRGRVAEHRRQHRDRRGTRRSPGRCRRRRRRVERTIVGGRGGARVLRDLDPQHPRREAAAGVGHHVALSIVGTERIAGSGYINAKVAQEKLIENSSVPYTIVHATQFFEFAVRIADGATVGDTVRVPPVLIQPMAADDVAAAVCDVALAAPLNSTIEIGGPEPLRFEVFVREGLRAVEDRRVVLPDPQARYFGARLDERSLVPGDARGSPRPGSTTGSAGAHHGADHARRRPRSDEEV